MTKEEFVKEIHDELTGSGALPIVVSENEIMRIARQEAKWFYEYYEHALYEHNYVIPRNSFNTDEFKADRKIYLPECVEAVAVVQEINGVGRLGNIDRDFSEARMIASEVFLSTFQGDDLVMRMAQYAYYDLTKALFLKLIQYNFNKNSHTLVIVGRDPLYDVYLRCWIRLEKEYLYEDYLFQRWVTAKAKVAFARIIGTYPFPLPGGVTINGDMYRTEGETEIEQIKTTIKETNVPDWIIPFN